MRKLFKKWRIVVGMVTLACSGGDLTAPISQSNNQNVPATIIITSPSSPDMVIGTSVFCRSPPRIRRAMTSRR
jgi:hypothetical protein